ncbi:NAD(P)-binding domain-containing protein [Calothrix sp. UHCC 0171]|uniref:NAD(P)-binding domain-containing protein n=1 Tax=Calothrix sp. UHCC 0171 TaxID=3110245 RepID=UPI002B1F2112|nr:NAD(P)-binding domain-containing protein [Calothrix sp. UHCC 0171]MEA5571636.1 NAD(P)-binding domain-containing protein [Calothrix sp. UHCC 0171]
MTIPTKVDYLIIGAGPAGLQLGYFLEKAKRNYIILEAGNSAGTFFKNFPRHKKLISINKVYTGYDNPEINLRWDWNSLLNDEGILFKNYSREYFPHTNDLVKYLNDFANHFQLKIKYNSQVTKIDKKDRFIVTDSNENCYSASRLIIATGFTKPYLPPIPGIELAENYVDVSINPEDFANQKVLILGKGNSAFETADNLVATTSLIHLASPNPVNMAWKTRYVGNLRAVNNNFLDTYQLKSQNILLNGFINKIEKDGNKFVVSITYTHANGEEEELKYDRIIVCTGFRFDDSIFEESCKPKLVINNRFPAQNSEWESVNVKDLYFIGTLSHMRDYKKKQSGFIHGFRYNVRALNSILEFKYENKKLPFTPIDATSESLTEAVIQRINVSSALWQQTGFLCDLIILNQDGINAEYYEALPTDYIHNSHLGQNRDYYTISLEFGFDILNVSPDPFAIERVHKDDVNNAAQSPSIHPIIRRFSGGKLIAEHHIIEDIASEWLEDVHVQPLLAFFTQQISHSKLAVGV